MTRPNLTPLSEIEIGHGYTRITGAQTPGRTYDSRMLPSWDHGIPIGIIIHRQGNPIPDINPNEGAHAINAIEWGIRTEAFSIHRYIEGETSYECVDLTRHAFHVKEWREAHEQGRPVYRTKFAARVVHSLEAPPPVERVGTPRGDIGQIGIEVVDRMREDGSIYFDQLTRRTLLLVVRDTLIWIARQRAEWLRDQPISVTGHQTWDHWTRPDDPGQALNMIDFNADLLDLVAGREPWRTTGVEYDGRELAKERTAYDYQSLQMHVAENLELATAMMGTAAEMVEAEMARLRGEVL